MTNKMKLIFVIATSVLALFLMLCTPFAGDIADHMRTVVANALNLQEMRTPAALAVLVISGLYLYFVLAQKRHS
jgi:hypothetical protein